MSVTDCIEFFDKNRKPPNVTIIKTTVSGRDYNFPIISSLEESYSYWKPSQLYDKTFTTFMKTKFFLYLCSHYNDSEIECVSRSLLSEVIESIETSNMTEMTTN